jgi:hypothetical protein
MTHYLLTGAGFSRNWGGWLGAEVFEYLLGCPELPHGTRMQLWRDKNERRGFEDSLAQMQAKARLGDQEDRAALATFQMVVSRMFEEMNNALALAPFDTTNDLASSLTGFLPRFDAIFTLNQDWLLEHHYLNGNIALTSARRWDGYQLPGIIGGVPDSISRSRPTVTIPATAPPDFELAPRMQPYFKLHGSSNWKSQDGKELLIVGGGKEDAIGGSPLLSSYAATFRRCLRQPGAKLMVIGYGFNDEHINRAILEAIAAGGLGIFIVDPAGTDVLDKRDPRLAIQPRPELLERMMGRLIGASRRPIRSTFGEDFAERAKLLRFFN